MDTNVAGPESPTSGFSQPADFACPLVPLWYRLLCPMCPDRPRTGTMGTQGTLRDASTLNAVRLGAERSPVQIRPPRLCESPLRERAFGISSPGARAGKRCRGTGVGTKRDQHRSGVERSLVSHPAAPDYRKARVASGSRDRRLSRSDRDRRGSRPEAPDLPEARRERGACAQRVERVETWTTHDGRSPRS
jgi:hypothetical protein